MNITLIFPDWVDVEATVEHNKKGQGIGHYSFAIGTLSAILKEHGHNVKLLHICYEPKKEEFKDLIIREYSDTNIFAFSYTEVEKMWVKNMNKWIKEIMNVFTIGGGLYPTLMPEETLLDAKLDAVCIGEGDYALPNICYLMEKDNGDYMKVKNIWINTKGGIVKNKTGEIVTDLNSLPRYDYDIFDLTRLKIFTSNLPRLFYLTTRNCHFGCSFCANHAKRKALSCGNKYVRRFTPERVINDLIFYTKKFPFIKLVHFADEVIHYDKLWFQDFAYLYKEKIGLPWRSYAMLKKLDDEIIRLMAYSGCIRVNCGIEAGSERIRKIYNRPPITNQEILYKISMLKDYGIDVHTSTLLNAPTETIDEMLSTIKLVARVNSDIAVTGIVVPYKGTMLYEFAKQKGLLSDTRYENTGVSIKPIECSKEKILFLYNAYRLIVEIYKKLYRVNKIIQKPLIYLFDLLIKSRFLPHNILIYIRKRYFEGKILNLYYRRLESKIGRREVGYKRAVKELLRYSNLK